MIKHFLLLSLISLLFFQGNLVAQTDSIPTRATPSMNYQTPTEYNLADIQVQGNGNINKSIIIAYTGLKTGQKIAVPGEDIANAIKKLWKQELFEDVQIRINKIKNNNIFLLIDLETRPRLSKFKFNGVSKGDASDIREKINIARGDILTKQVTNSIEKKIKSFYKEDGYLNATVNFEERVDTASSNNTVTLIINVDKGEKIKIKDITFSGNKEFDDNKLRRTLENTNRKSLLNLFKSAKFKPSEYEKDKKKLIQFYNKHGYRDAEIASDSIYFVSEKRIKIHIDINRGNQYYFGDITWKGNTKYSTSFLNTILGIKKGDVYNTQKLQRNLNFNQKGLDVSSLYMDNGYLFFNVQPVEVQVSNDTVDIEIRIHEGEQATIDEVTVSGNTKTSDHVILRELRTRPGDKFSRSDIIRSRRELSQLGYFDAEKINVSPQPNPEEGTVDINYDVVEKPSDQLQLQGGWGAGQLVGSVGIQFNNFALDKFFEKDAWRPLPSGDGQKLSLRAYSNGRRYTSLNFSFTEPWFGGKKPNSLTVSAYHSIQTNGREKGHPNRQELNITGFSLGLGKRLEFPDDYFTLNHTINFQQYSLNDYRGIFSFNNGKSYNISMKHKLERNSVDKPIYPTSGSKFSLSVKYTPPYSSFSNTNYGEATAQERYKWIEYHKWNFESSYFLNIAGDLVFNPRVKFGYMGYYNDNIGVSPFERYYVGGDGIQNFSLDGRELVRLRGYDNNSLSPSFGASTYNKYTFELRYPLTTQRSATVYFLTFAEAGNSWLNFENVNPFDVHRSAGAGVRIFLPMFGLLGLDWGYGFDDPLPGQPNTNAGGSQFHISIGQQF